MADNTIKQIIYVSYVNKGIKEYINDLHEAESRSGSFTKKLSKDAQLLSTKTEQFSK